MTTIICIGVYLVGCVILYLLLKYSPGDSRRKMWQFSKPKEYLVRDRIENIKTSFFSWIFIIAWVFAAIGDIFPKPKEGWWEEYLNKPAKW